MNRLSRQISEQAPTFDRARDQITRHAPMRLTVCAPDVYSAASSNWYWSRPPKCLKRRHASRPVEDRNCGQSAGRRGGVIEIGEQGLDAGSGLVEEVGGPREQQPVVVRARAEFLERSDHRAACCLTERSELLLMLSRG